MAELKENESQVLTYITTTVVFNWFIHKLNLALFDLQL